MILNHPSFQRFENIPFIVCNFKFFLDINILLQETSLGMVGFLCLNMLNYALYLTFTVRKCAIGNTGAVVFYPHYVPTGLRETRGLFVFYPPHVPTGLREIPGLLFSTHLASLQDSWKQRLRCFLLPTSHPYGTSGNTGFVVFYPPRVPTGLLETTAPVFSTTYIASLQDSGKHRGPFSFYLY